MHTIVVRHQYRAGVGGLSSPVNLDSVKVRLRFLNLREGIGIGVRIGIGVGIGVGIGELRKLTEPQKLTEPSGLTDNFSYEEHMRATSERDSGSREKSGDRGFQKTDRVLWNDRGVRTDRDLGAPKQGWVLPGASKMDEPYSLSDGEQNRRAPARYNPSTGL
jgi:hypothetical protein